MTLTFDKSFLCIFVSILLSTIFGNYDNFDDSEIFVKFSMSVYDCGNFDESEILHKCRQL